MPAAPLDGIAFLALADPGRRTIHVDECLQVFAVGMARERKLRVFDGGMVRLLTAPGGGRAGRSGGEEHPNHAAPPPTTRQSATRSSHRVAASHNTSHPEGRPWPG